MLEIITLPVLSDNYIFLLHEPVSGDTAVVDPAVAEPVLAELSKRNWQLTHILNTHHHWDHVGANLELQQQTGCRIIASLHDRERIPGIDKTVGDGDQIHLGGSTGLVMETPGHTLGHIVYYFPDAQSLFCGDTLFVMGCGRLFEGSAAQMHASLQKLRQLPDATRIYCAHEYTQANARFALRVDPDNPDLHEAIQEIERLRKQNLPTIPSTIAREKACNPFFRTDDSGLQKTLGMQGQPAAEVFARLRSLKDHF